MRSSAVFLSASLLLVAVAAQDAAPQAPAPPKRPADAAALFAAFARMPGLEASYREEKHLSLLAVPLVSKGKLWFTAPGHLRREVREPEPSVLLITPRQLRMEGRDGAEVVDLQRSDRLQLFVTSLVRVFAGDREALKKHYAIEFAADERDDTAWHLVLTPRAEALQQMVKALRLDGRGFAVSAIEVLDPNGDRTVTTIVDADPERVFTPVEKRDLFGIEPPGGAAPQKAR